MALVTMVAFPSRGDLAVPETYYRAMPYAEWTLMRFANFWVLLVAWICLSELVRKRFSQKRHRSTVVLLLADVLVFLLLLWCSCRHIQKFGQQLLSAHEDQELIVSPRIAESREKYLERVDRLKQHFCQKCDVQKQRRLRIWRCPKCEPDFFTCPKCGSEKIHVYREGYWLYCPKCDDSPWIRSRETMDLQMEKRGSPYKTGKPIGTPDSSSRRKS